MNVADCIKQEKCQLVDWKCEITDVNPVVGSGELVDITVEGLFPRDPYTDFDFTEWGFSFRYLNTDAIDCLGNFDITPGAEREVSHIGDVALLYVGLYDQDDLSGEDEIDYKFLNAQSKIAIYEDANYGNCLSFPFKVTFYDVPLSNFADGGDIELYAACAAPESQQLSGETEIGELTACDSGNCLGFRSPETKIDVDTTPPPAPAPQAAPSGWTADTTPNIFGYAVVDIDSGIDYYEYSYDTSTWYNLGMSTQFDTSPFSDGIHPVYVKAVDKAGLSSQNSVTVYINSRLNCECSSGECCDGCYYKGSGTKCQDGSNPVYSCYAGNGPGSDVYVQTQYRKCTGSSTTCSGTLYNNPVEVYNDCGPGGYCNSNSCSTCSTTCDNSCQSANCYGVDPDCTSSGGSTKCSDLGGYCSAGKCAGVSCGYSTSLPCVGSDGCLRPKSTQTYWMCQQAISTEYGCMNGNMADDNVFYREYNKYCSGISPNCDGPYKWGYWNIQEDCSGSQYCASDGDTSCTNAPAESCDNIDNDRDGIVDEDLIGSICPLQQGVCSGKTKLCQNGAWQNCGASAYGEFYESAEQSCDLKDNDCDGSIDEGLPRVCGVTDTGNCSLGTEYCTSGSWTTCNAVFPKNETCDGVDTDCDGVLDGSENLGWKQCYTTTNSSFAGVGICSYGHYDCNNSGWGNDCIGDVAPRNETCGNYLDDDCDGEIDDAATCYCTNGTTMSCSNQLGVCAGSNETCVNNSWGFGGCSVNEYNHSGSYQINETICDGKDNDCDGIMDEGCLILVEIYLIYPKNNSNVTQNKFFNFSSGIICLSGDCGNLNATLYVMGSSNATPKICSQVWGLSCGTGPPETGLDNTFDSCNSGGGNDESVEEIYLSASSVKYGDSLKVTCEYDPFTSGDYYYIWYYNGSGWRNLYVEGPTGSSSKVNISVNFTPDNIQGTHWIRCSISYSTYNNDGCADGMSYFDNDDINFNLVDSEKVIPMNSGTPFYTLNGNPAFCTNVQLGASCNTTWRVNATGAVNSTWPFYVAYTPSTTRINKNMSSIVSIKLISN